MGELEEFYTRKDLMKMFKVSESTIIRWEKRGLIKKFKLPGSKKVLYRKSDIEKLIEKGIED